MSATQLLTNSPKNSCDITTSNSLDDLAARIREEHDGGVDTKCRVGATFGNDGHVDTKSLVVGIFGNDGIGFIRVRRRKLKGGQPSVRALPSLYGERARGSVSFDLVKAVRVDGKPRHKFVLGLGSQKDGATGRVAAHMLLLAIGRMKRHGLNVAQRRALLTELIRKGARRPTIAECEGWNMNSTWTAYVDELAAWLSGADAEVRS